MMMNFAGGAADAGIGLTFSKTGAAAIHTVHHNVVKQFFLEMDDDKSGFLDEDEVRMLALALGKNASNLPQELNFPLLEHVLETALLVAGTKLKDSDVVRLFK